jgi:predicted RNA-binding Zn-ribbon protein involved in translation (DUF1610 family)
MGWTFSPVNGQVCRFQWNGAPTDVIADGDNVTWNCPNCGLPLLFVYQKGRLGSHYESPVTCNQCKRDFYLEPSYGSTPEPPKDDDRHPAPIMTFRRR